MLLSLVYKIINYVYGNIFFVYNYFYFFYKNVSDKEKIKLLKREIRPGMIILDLGGNIGFYSILFSKLVGTQGKVHVFEPDTLNFKYLKKNTQKFENIKLYNMAVGLNSGPIKLYKSKDLNVDHRTYDSDEERDYIEVPCVSIDEFFNDKTYFDFVKIDIQGYDCHAFEGMQRTIQNSKNIRIVSELWPYGLNKAGRSVDKYLDLLTKMGFVYHIFDNKNINEIKSEETNKFYYTDLWCEKV